MCVLVYTSVYIRQHQSTSVSFVSWSRRSHLRSAIQGSLLISYCRTKRYGQRSFVYSGSSLWNSLPLTARDPSISLTQFYARLKSVMFCEPTTRPVSAFVRVSTVRFLLREKKIYLYIRTYNTYIQHLVRLTTQVTDLIVLCLPVKEIMFQLYIDLYDLCDHMIITVHFQRSSFRNGKCN